MHLQTRNKDSVCYTSAQKLSEKVISAAKNVKRGVTKSVEDIQASMPKYYAIYGTNEMMTNAVIMLRQAGYDAKTWMPSSVGYDSDGHLSAFVVTRSSQLDNVCSIIEPSGATLGGEDKLAKMRFSHGLFGF